ncbi:hypothetical protein V3C99_015241 [Haemonchus contortus]
MLICALNARMLAREACIEIKMQQARKNKHEVFRLTDTRIHGSPHVIFVLEKNCPLEHATAKATTVWVSVDTHLAVNIDPYESMGMALWLNPSSHNIRCPSTNIKLRKE